MTFPSRDLWIVRAHPRLDGWEVVPADDLAARGFLWRTLPEAVAELPGAEVRLDGVACWLERVPAGALASDLAPTPEASLPLLAAVARHLADLHASGRVHGAVGPDTTLITPEGVRLVGAGVSPGTRADDRGRLAAWTDDVLRRLDRQVFPGTLTLTEMAVRLEEGVRGVLPVGPPRPLPAPAQALNVSDPDGDLDRSVTSVDLTGEVRAEALDEVVFDYGPEPTGELSRSDSLRTATQVDAYGTADSVRSVVSLLVAPLAPTRPDRFAGSEGTPSSAMRRLLADEPMDVLVVPEDLPTPVARSPMPVTATFDTVVDRRATTIPGRDESQARQLRWVAVLAILGLVAALFLFVGFVR